MGYPMTFRRLLARNGLLEGDYAEIPQDWRAQINTDAREPVEADLFTALPPDRREDASADAWNALANDRAGRLVAIERRASMLAGDLRRLERDAVDENWLCSTIAQRTGIDADTVAAVLKEFVML